MGVPKFFRYISERYPCLSELVKEYQIPEFDNLYLDMNGIIHMCSHPDDGNVHFRISEEKIFKDVFHYIEVLFRMIKPQKLFFMAVDGVAPRAKMNQQRGRRFRSAKDAEKQEADAIKKGEQLPKEARFDSNCITPGTVFMTRLQEQLKYFVVDKISNDPLWQHCNVILSGHETPGEGEHKIMDYIRYMRAQPGYDPNTRHCLYGLDADLIMLGLCTHEPHFSLLREEVKFGKKSSKSRVSVPEEITFFLLHLSLMREYLELEFISLKDKLIGFSYDFEKIIDDWVLMGFLVGNDFIPHLPNLHITNGALPILYKAYMDILPSLDGYINEGGKLNLVRFEKFMEKLGALDMENFEEVRDDLLYMEAKTGKKYSAHSKVSTKTLEKWSDESPEDVDLITLEPELECPRDSGLAALIRETDELALSDDDDGETEDSLSEDDIAFSNYKKEYYMNKLEYAKVTADVLRSQAEGYVRAIQWNLNYYYNGCCSWSWYYPHHYAPYISDIKGFSDLKIEFDLGKPFLPYQQLLAVLPTASKELLPSCFHSLMVDENSMIKKYYPEEFQTDLNGKKQEWEAVVLVPFIDENLLLEAMSYCNDKLTTAEKERNKHGPMLIYMFSPRSNGVYQSPGYFPNIPRNHTIVKTMMYNEIILPQNKLIKGAYPGVKMDVYYPGFPTLKHLKYKAELKNAKIKVFEHPSRSENMIITLIPNEKFLSEAIPVDLLGRPVFVGWPHLVEAKVVAISNSKKKFVSMGGPNQFNVEDQSSPQTFKQQLQGIQEHYQKRMGIEFGETKVLVHVQVMIGRKYMFSPNGRLTLEKQFTQNTSYYPLQTVVYDIAAFDSNASVFRDVEQVFPNNSICFTLTSLYYGSQGVVLDSSEVKKTGRVKISLSVAEEPKFHTVNVLYSKTLKSYKNLYAMSNKVGIPNTIFSRVTGTVFVTVRSNSGEFKSINVGLDLKLNKKNKETPGYTRKINNNWHYTEKAANLVINYSQLFPEIVSYLSVNNTFEEVTAERIFGDNWEQRIKELQNWLKSLPSYSIEKQTCGSIFADPETVEEIERIVDHARVGHVKKVTMAVKPNVLYRPEVQNGTLMPDPKTETQILDRIVNVREGYSVPFGLKGTVIAIQQSATGSDRDILYDVLFDKPFRDGMKLNCSENRGYRLPDTSFINLSYGRRLLKQKSGQNDERTENPAELSSEASRRNDVFSASPQKWIPAQHQIRVDPIPPPCFNQSAFAHFSIANAQRSRHNNSVEAFYNKDKINQIKNEYTRFQKEEIVQGEQQQILNKNETDIDDQKKEQSEREISRQEKSQSGSVEKETSRQPQEQDFWQWDGKQAHNTHSYRHYGSYQPNGYYGQPHNKQYQQWRQPQCYNPNSNINQRDNNCFVPNFSNNGLRPIMVDRPPNDEMQRPQQATVNTNFLKNLLKIGSSTTENNTKITQDDVKKTTLVVNNKDTSMASNNISFDMLKPVANIPASIRLLTYYQSNALGLPRYQYCNVENMIEAQIKLSNGTLVVGKPAITREEASENVAAEVLIVLMKKDNVNDESISSAGGSISSKNQVPELTGNNVNIQSKNNGTLAKSEENSTKLSRKKGEARMFLNNSFVPLQAVRNHIINTSTSKPDKNKDNKMAEKFNVNESKGVAPKKVDSPNGREIKSRRGRKTRIAANFSSMK